MLAVLVDTGLGNLHSVEKALRLAAERSGRRVSVERSKDPDRMRHAHRLIVPGQGGFQDGARALSAGLGPALIECLRAGIPYLGICLGLQLLFDEGDEAPGERGLGWFSGRVVRLERAPGIKIPHMGWNQLELSSPARRELEAMNREPGGAAPWAYFVHSYHAKAEDPTLVSAVSSYGPNRITAAVSRDNVLATQFHPEKSQAGGIRLLEAFLQG